MGQADRFAPNVPVRWHPEQVTAEIDGEVVVMALAQGKYVGFNDIASAVWRRLGAPVTVAALCDGLAGDFDGDPEAIRQDVVALLARLDELGLVEVGLVEVGTSSAADG